MAGMKSKGMATKSTGTGHKVTKGLSGKTKSAGGGSILVSPSKADRKI